MKRTERHHCVPLSIGGHDISENIVFVAPDEHTNKEGSIHSVLNMEYNSIRTYRKRTNHILFPNETSVRELALVQDLYFQNIGNLKPFLLELHANSLEAQVKRLVKLWDLHEFTFKDTSSFDMMKKFRYWLSSYHAAHLICVLRPYKH